MTAPENDDEDVAAFLAGDAAAFARLVGRHQTLVGRFCQRYLGSPSVAADLTQEVFVTLWEERRRYVHQGKLRAYLLTIARFRCLAHVKKHGRLVPYDSDERSAAGADAGALREQLRRSIRRLEPELAELVVLRFLEELKLEEIAELTALPLGTVKSRLHRAVALLRQEWS